MGIDVGTKTIGIAISDPMEVIAEPRETYWRKNTSKDIAYLYEMMCKEKVELLVVGCPLSDTQEETEMSVKIRSFIKQFEKKMKYVYHPQRKVPIVYWDERYTTQDAELILREQSVKKNEWKKTIDGIAASLILRSYMEGNMSEHEHDQAHNHDCEEQGAVETIELLDEEGHPTTFEIVANLYLDDQEYAILSDGEAEDEVIIFRVKLENESYIFEAVEDDEEIQAVLDAFQELLAEQE